jgi:hypothetical protein
MKPAVGSVIAPGKRKLRIFCHAVIKMMINKFAASIIRTAKSEEYHVSSKRPKD